MKKCIAFVIASGSLLLAGCTTFHHTSTAWEYRVVRAAADSSDLQEQLNKAGGDGFAFVSSQTLPGDQNSRPVTIVILKKAKR